MDEDDLPPQPVERDTGFSGALGLTVSTFAWVGAFVAAIVVVLLALKYWG